MISARLNYKYRLFFLIGAGLLMLFALSKDGECNKKRPFAKWKLQLEMTYMMQMISVNPATFSPLGEEVKMGCFNTSFLCLLSTPKVVRLSPTHR